jgi:hypothetical protein
MMGARAVALACMLWAPSVIADVSPGDAVKAKALFDQGQAEMDAGKIDAACATFETSFKLDPQIGARLNLADCRERQGKIVEAYALFAGAADEAARTKKQGRESFARQRMAALQPKLVRVTVRIAEPAPGIAVMLGERSLPQAQWAVEQVVRPGRIVVDATASGRQPYHLEENAVAGSAIEIVVPALPPTAVTATATSETPVPTPTPAPASPSRFDRTTLILGGGGIGLILVSGAVALHAKSRWDTAYHANDRSGVSSAQTEADVGTGVFVVGAAVLTVGIVRYLRTRPDPDHVAIAPAVGGGMIGLTVAGSL